MLRKGALVDRFCVFVFWDMGAGIKREMECKSCVFLLVGEIGHYIMFNCLTYLKR